MKIRSASPRLTLNARGAKGLPLPHRHRDTNSVAEFHTPLWRPVEDQTGHLLTLVSIAPGIVGL